MPANRSLAVTVHVTGTEASNGTYTATATYTQTGSHPSIPDLIGEHGDIDLGILQPHPDYNWAIGMVFTLDATNVKDRNGNTVPCNWADTAAQACAITGPGGGGTNGMAVSELTTTQVTIANPNNDHNKTPVADRTYGYTLGVMLPTLNDFFISLDPRIVNTGPTTG